MRHRIGTWIERSVQDVRYGCRLLWRSPGFTAVAVVSLALGIGVNALGFSIVNALVLKPLPIEKPGDVYFIQGQHGFPSVSYPAYTDFRDRNTTFDGLIGYRVSPMSVEVSGQATRAWGYLATGNYFDLLGVAPAVGRFFHQFEDLEPGRSPLAVLSYDSWTTRFGRNPSVVGTTIRINRLPYTVIGVASQGFYGTELFYRPEIWVPMMMEAQIEVGNPWLDKRMTSNVWMAGRVKHGVTSAQASANLNAIAAELAREHPVSDRLLAVALTRPGLVGDALGGPVRAFTLGLMLLAGLVLLTACANLASLLLSRGADRQRELAIRISLGAGSGRLVRQLLTETLLLAGAGGAAGWLLAIALSRALTAWRLPVEVPVQFDVRSDWRVFLFAFFVTSAAGILFGIAPARQAWRLDPNVTLKGAPSGDRGLRWASRDVIVLLQVAASVVLLSACLLSLRGLGQMLTMPLGFEPRGVSVVAFELGLAGYSKEDGARFQQRALDAIVRLPGVSSAAYSNSLPLSIDQSTTTIYPDAGRANQPSDARSAIYYQVSPGFFRTLDIRLLAGRDFDWHDAAGRPQVAVVNEAFARQLLGTVDAVGRRFRYGITGEPVEVVGVAAGGKYQTLTEDARPVVFEPILQSYNATTTLIARSRMDEIGLAAEMGRAIGTLDAGLPVYGSGSVDQLLDLARFPSRAAAAALTGFGLLAVVLAATGIHGIASYAVAKRRRELGIRIAIGATRFDVLTLVLRRMAMLLAFGAVLGLAAAAAAGRVLASIVYLASPYDPIVFGGVCLLMAAVSLAACWAPARRSLRVDPVSALRAE